MRYENLPLALRKAGVDAAEAPADGGMFAEKKPADFTAEEAYDELTRLIAAK